MVANFINTPVGFNEAWLWIAALDAWDYCDPAPLDELLNGAKEIPEEIRPALADIVSGRRRPNKKAAAKLKVPAGERMKIAGEVSCILGLIDVFKRIVETTPQSDDDGDDPEIAAERARWRRMEPKDKLAELNEDARHEIATTAAELGVSVETVENYLRDLRKKIENWPLV